MALRMHCGIGQSQVDGKGWRNEVAVNGVDKGETKARSGEDRGAWSSVCE